MADFPALIPSQAPITPGNWPMAGHQSMDGKRGNVRTGSLEIGRTWTPIFENIIEADYLTILAHYRAHRLQFNRFSFTGTTLAAALTPTGYAWRWAEPPQVVDRHADVFVIRCAFSCVPRPLVSMRGGQWRSAASTFTRGAFAGVFGAFETGGQWASAASTFTRGAFSGGLGVFELGGRWGSAQTVFTRGAFSGTSGIFESGARWVSAATTFVRGRIAGASVFEAGAQWASEATTFTRGAFASTSNALLVQFAGADNSTTFTDTGPLGLVGAAFGDAKITAANGKFGGSSGTFDGAGDYVSFPSASVPRFTGDFTIEVWAYPTDINDRTIASGNHASDSNIQIFRMHTSGRLEFYANNQYVIQATSAGIVANQWQHLRITRNSNNTRMYLNGEQVGPTNTSWAGAFTCNIIGHHFFNGSSYYNPGQYAGRLSEFRTATVAYSTGSSFAVPTGPFPAP
jgi:hypothetical protein